MKTTAPNLIVTFLAGAAAGTILGLLYAPDKGFKTRKRILKKALKVQSDLVDNVNDRVDNLNEHFTDLVGNVSSRFNSLESDIREISKQAENVVNVADNKHLTNSG